MTSTQHARMGIMMVGLLLGLGGRAAEVRGQALGLGSQQVSGTIRSVDAEQRIMQLEISPSAGRIAGAKKGTTMDFVLPNSAVVGEEARNLQPTDLQVGAEAHVFYTVENGKNVAQSIHFQHERTTRTPAPIKPEAELNPYQTPR